MNSVYVATASRIYAALCATKDLRDCPVMNAKQAFELARHFMVEYDNRYREEQASFQKFSQQYPGAVMGRDPLEPNQNL